MKRKRIPSGIWLITSFVFVIINSLALKWLGLGTESGQIVYALLFLFSLPLLMSTIIYILFPLLNFLTLFTLYSTWYWLSSSKTKRELDKQRREIETKYKSYVIIILIAIIFGASWYAYFTTR